MTREQTILRAAADAFSAKGFHGVSMDELGRRAGFSGPALYRSFSGKDEILATLLNEALDELMSATISVHDDPALDLDRALRHHIHFSATNRPLVSLYQREVRSLADPWKRPFDRRQRQYIERWEHLLRQHSPHLTAERAAQTVQSTLGTVFSMTAWPGRTLRGESVEENLLAFLQGALDTVNATSSEPTPAG
jgi:AcrR family transcriptional regulator